MHELAKVGFHQSYTYFTWRNEQGRAAGVPRRSCRRRPAHYMRPELLRQHPGHPARVAAVRRAAGVQDPRRARRHCSAPTWGVYSGYELYEHVAGPAGQRGVPGLREVPVPAARLGRRRGRGPQLAPYLTLLNRVRRAHPALQRLRNLTLPRRPTTTTSSPTRKTGLRPDGDVGHRARRGQPRPARAPARPRCTSTCRRSGCDWDEPFVVHDEVTGETYGWGGAQLRPPRPATASRPTCCTVRRSGVTRA